MMGKYAELRYDLYLKFKKLERAYHQIRREKLIRYLVIFMFFVWTIGTLVVFTCERAENEEFSSIGRALWNIAIYLFSGLDSGQPGTPVGQIVVVSILISSTLALAVITGTLASMFIEIRSKGRYIMPDSYVPRNHIVMCNWNRKSIHLIKQLHAGEVTDKKAIIVISENDEACDFKDIEKNSEPLVGVYKIKGNPSDSMVLRRANLKSAHSIIVMADLDDEEHSDGKSLFICMAIKEVLDEGSILSKHDGQHYITVEAVDSASVKHFKRAGADEVVCEEEFGTLLLSQSAYQPGLASVYRELLTFSDEADSSSELYTVELKEDDIAKGITFSELGEKIYKNRSKVNPIILVGGYSASKQKFILNPHEEEQFKPGDKALVMALEKPSTEDLY